MENRVSKRVKSKILFLLFAAALLLAGKDGSGQDIGEGERLQEQEQLLSQKVGQLKSDQDFLLFEKTMYASDSKYLVIRSAAKKGQLKYRNRILKDFHFTRAGRGGRLKEGMASVTKKIEGTRERNALLFGTSFSMEGKRGLSTPPEPGVPRLVLSKRDFLSVYYAMEAGAPAYVLP